MRIDTTHLRLCLGAAASLLVASSPVAEAGTLDGARFLFHVQPVTGKVCDTGAALARDTDCATYPSGQFPLQAAYHVFLVAASPAGGAGFGGMDWGIEYDDAASSGVDVYDWTLCGNIEFPSPGWPAAGSANRIVWSSCQQAVPTGGTFIQAVAGAFYVYAFSDDVMEITPDRRDFCYGQLGASDCTGGESSPSFLSMGSVGFGSLAGLNPCNVVQDGTICALYPMDGDSDWHDLDFGTVLIGSSRDLTLRISPSGVGTGLPSFDVGPIDAGDFTIVSGEGHHEGPVQQNVDVVFRFAPTVPGVQEFSFEVEPCTLCPPVTLTGTGEIEVPVVPARWGQIKTRYE